MTRTTSGGGILIFGDRRSEVDSDPTAFRTKIFDAQNPRSPQAVANRSSGVSRTSVCHMGSNGQWVCTATVVVTRSGPSGTTCPEGQVFRSGRCVPIGTR
jgi:hypothetical protein